MCKKAFEKKTWKARARAKICPSKIDKRYFNLLTYMLYKRLARKKPKKNPGVAVFLIFSSI